jgi:hypothetical protein
MQLQEINQFKDQLLADTSHELLAPLHAVSGLMETVRESLKLPLFNEQRKMLGLALSSIRRLNHFQTVTYNFGTYIFIGKRESRTVGNPCRQHKFPPAQS